MNEKAPPTAVLTPPRPPIAILGVPFDPVTTNQAVEAITAMIASRRSHYAVTANVDFVVQALEDIELRKIIFDAHLVLCDGMPLVWASRLLGNPLPERVTGSDLVPRLLAEAERRGWRVFFLGGRQESLDNAANRSLEKHPRLRLVGAYSPPFKPLLELDHTEILKRISTARPDLLLVAFGCPKQEKWINMHYRHLGVPVSIGVGATIAFIGGTLRRAPVWMQRSGTEWLFRLLQEPGRLGGRYSKGLWVFSRAILRQWRLFRSHRRLTQATPKPTPAGTPPTQPSSPPPRPRRSQTVLTAPERFDAVAVSTLGETWVDAGDDANLVVDLGATRFIDSTGVGLLVRLRKRTDLRRASLTLCRCTPPVERALQLMRIEGFFERSSSLPSARPQATASFDSPLVSIHTRGTGLAITWHGHITALNRDEIGSEIEPRIAALAPGTDVECDLSEVLFADSSGIGLLVGLKKRAWREQVHVVFRNPSPMVLNVMRLTSLEEYLLEEQRT